MKRSDGEKGATMVEIIMILGILGALSVSIATLVNSMYDRYRVSRVCGQIEEFKKLGMKYTADVNIAHVLYLQQYFGVSFQSMIYRLNNLTLISDKQKETFLLYQPTAVAREYGYSTSLYTPTNEKIVLGDYSAKAQSLFNKELISEGHLIDLLSEIKLDE